MNNKNVKLIWAQDRNGCIGKNNTIPWHLPGDLKRFKTLTEGGVVLMGRKTWESLPEAYRPLPNRRNLVVSSNPNFEINHPNVEVIRNFICFNNTPNVWVIGGGEVYYHAMYYASEIEVTQVDLVIPDGDAFAPAINRELFELTNVSEKQQDPTTLVEYTFCNYRRK